MDCSTLRAANSPTLITRTTVMAGSSSAAAAALSFCTYSGWATCSTEMPSSFSVLNRSASAVIVSPSGPVNGLHIWID